MHVKRRLKSSKNVIVIGESDFIGDKTQSYYNAKSVCESVCGDLFFPSSFEENFEVGLILDAPDLDSYQCTQVYLRLVYDATERIWKDPDNKGTGCNTE